MRTYFYAVLASVLWVGVLAAQPQPGQAPAKPRPVILVEAVYPGANAHVVAETVDAPIEQQLKGMAKVAHMISRSGNDGSYLLKIVLEHGADLDAAQKEVQTRLAEAQKALPAEVKSAGITIRKWSGQVPMFVKTHSPDGTFDNVYLTNYARLPLEDELKRLPGVAAVDILGGSDQAVRITLDMDKLAAFELSVADATKVLRDKGNVAAGKIGQPPLPPGAKQFQFTISPPASLKDHEKELKDLVVTTTAKGETVRLKDIAKIAVEMQGAPGEVRHKGKSAVLLSIATTHNAKPAEVMAAVQNKLKQQQAKLPVGLALDIAFDPADSADHLLLDVTLPPAASVDRTLKACDQCASLLAEIEGIQDVLTFADPSASYQACLLVRLAPSAKKPVEREKLKKAIRTVMAEKLPEGRIQLRDCVPSSCFPWPDDYPIAIGIVGPDEKAALAVAKTFAQRLAKTGKVTDIGVEPDAETVPIFSIAIDRKKLAEHGVSVKDVFDIIQLHTGGFHLNDFNRFGRHWSVVLHADAKLQLESEKLVQLKVRTDKGQMVPLKEFITLEVSQSPAAIVRWDGAAVVKISANPAAGVSIGAIRKHCEALAKDELPKGYRLVWLAE